MLKANKRNTYLFLSLIISLITAILVEKRIFTDPYAINDDVRNQIYWMAKLIDPDYFRGDYIADYFSQSSMVSPLYKLFFSFCASSKPLFSLGLDPKLISQYMVFPIILATTYALFKLGELHKDSRFAFWLCFVFTVYIWMMKFIAGALPRSFFYLLFFTFLYFWQSRKSLSLHLCVVLQALIYPTAFFISWSTLVADWFLSKQKSNNTASTNLSLITSTLTVSLPILYFRYIFNKDHRFGSLYNFAEAIKMPEFYIDKRHPVFIVPSNFIELISKPSNLVIISFVAITFLIWAIYAYRTFGKALKLQPALREAFRQPSYLWTSALASIVLFVVAHFLLFYLYLPHRYIAYVLPLVPIFILATSQYESENRMISAAKQRWTIYVYALIAVFAFSSSLDDDLISVSKQEKLIFNYLSKTPKDSLIVAPLKFASNIPAFSYRSVLLSSESDIPYHKLYYAEIKKRQALQNAIYKAQSQSELRSYAKEYGIDYVIVDSKEPHSGFLDQMQSDFKTKRFFIVAMFS